MHSHSEFRIQNSESPPIVLTIAGSDSGGGAGIQADLKTFEAHSVFGTTVITAVTAQNTKGVSAWEAVSDELVRKQLEAVLQDLRPSAIKTGMLANAGIIKAVCDILSSYPEIPLVVDPVMLATSGDALIKEDAITAYQELLFPMSSIITPNIPEAIALLEIDPNTPAEALATKLGQFNSQYVLVKGGHASGDEMTDYLYNSLSGEIESFSSKRIDTRNNHGTGCTLSAAICSNLALGKDMSTAVKDAKAYLFKAMQYAKDWHLGSGAGPVAHKYGL